jgi:nicotinamide-nucleotide amidase
MTLRRDQTPPGKKLEEIVGRLLTKGKLTIAIAESCTGGAITHRLTNVAGSSRYLVMSVIAYANSAKSHLLGVSPSLIKKVGAVSSEVAEAMARGVKKKGRVHIGLSATGIAGPGGGSKKKPVGLVYISLVYQKRCITEHHQFQGSRRHIKAKSVRAALNLLRKSLTP